MSLLRLKDQGWLTHPNENSTQLELMQQTKAEAPSKEARATQTGVLKHFVCRLERVTLKHPVCLVDKNDSCLGIELQ
jgi:hypothetical protein